MKIEGHLRLSTQLANSTAFTPGATFDAIKDSAWVDRGGLYLGYFHNRKTEVPLEIYQTAYMHTMERNVI